MIDAPFHRLSEFVTLGTSEVEALAAARGARLSFKRRQRIATEGDPVCSVYLLVEGWAGTSMEVDFGRRQMLKVHLPGDILGLPSIALTRAAETVTALTNVVVDVIPLSGLAQLFETTPRLALSLFVISQQERVMLMDHLAAVGQTSAMQRVCALLLHVHRRLKVLHAGGGPVLEWPLSQRHMAEGAGLTSVHVNRTLRELERRRLIEREGKRIRLLDLQRLAELSGLSERTYVHEPEWLASRKPSAVVPRA